MAARWHADFDGFWLSFDSIDRSTTKRPDVQPQCDRCFKPIKDGRVHMCHYEDVLCMACFEEIGAKSGQADRPLCVWPLRPKKKSPFLEHVAGMLPKDRPCRRKCKQVFASLERLLLHEKEECPLRDRQCTACGSWKFPSWMATHMNLAHHESYSTLGTTLKWACDGRTPDSRVIGMYTPEASRLEMFTVNRAVDEEEGTVFLWVSHSDFTTNHQREGQTCQFACRLALMSPNGKSEVTCGIMRCSPTDAERGDGHLSLEQSQVQTALDKVGCFQVSITIFESGCVAAHAKQLWVHDGKNGTCLTRNCESEGIPDWQENADPDFFDEKTDPDLFDL